MSNLNHTIRRKHTPELKAEVALHAICSQKTAVDLAKQFRVHPSQILRWKRRLLDRLPELFIDGRIKKKKNKLDQEKMIVALYRQINQLTAELDWLKNKLVSSVENRRSWIGKHPRISIRRQCQLLDINH